MFDSKTLLGLLTIAIGIVSYSFYFHNIFKGKTKPEPFSWLIWGVLATITFFAQRAKDGGAGTWATAFTAIVCFLIALTVYARHDGHMKRIDEISLAGAFAAIAFWYFTNNPLWAVILAVAVGAIGFIPTFQKAFYKPEEETAITYFLNALKFAIALFALQSFNPVTFLYPAALILMNVSLSAMLVFRKSPGTTV